MSPTEVDMLISLLKALEGPALEAVEAIVAALKKGDDPTPSVRHLEVQAAFQLLGIKDV